MFKQKRVELEKRKERALERHLKEELDWINKSPKAPKSLPLFSLLSLFYCYIRYKY
jgi:hypothetical protein